MKNVYIHIPFCSHICSYCDFAKIKYNKKYINDYLKALEKEIKHNYHNELIETLYVGGGTPSSLSIEELKNLFNILKIFKLKDNYEFTFECNIENTTIEKLNIMYTNGVNRLSFGVQTFNDRYLKLLNRYHNKQAVFNIIGEAKKIGFKNINVDLIYGISLSILDDLKDDIDNILKLDITHISTYSLIIENNTLLKINGYTNIDEDIEYEMYKYINKVLTKHGFEQYEISNYAKNDNYSKHNLNYWNNNSYYGFGLGAVAYIDNYRIENTKNINEYMRGNYIMNRNYEDEKIRMSNEIILGLRKIKGIDMQEFYNKYGKKIEEVYDITDLISQNKLILDGNYLRIKADYLYLSNEILINFVD